MSSVIEVLTYGAALFTSLVALMIVPLSNAVRRERRRPTGRRYCNHEGE